MAGKGTAVSSGTQLRDRVAGRPIPRPLLKWAGGKGQLLDEILPRLAAAGPHRRYLEPFVGGGAVFFELARVGRLPGEVGLSDANPNLVEMYRAVRDDVEAVIARLLVHAERHGSSPEGDHFYEVRESEPTDRLDRAARVIYLNKTCFNGLYRENSKGRFNVPFGRNTNPTICDAPNLRACAAALRQADLRVRSFERVLDDAGPGDLVYFDPPYVPVSATASFTGYARDGFGDAEQVRLAEVYAELVRRGARVLLSNSMTPRVRELYAAFAIDTVHATRAVNSRADRRGKIEEALVRSFPYEDAR